MKLDLKFDKIKKDLAADNEVSVSVTWNGGGQHIKARKYIPSIYLDYRLIRSRMQPRRTGTLTR